MRDGGRVLQFIWAHPANRHRRIRQLGRACGFQLRARMIGARAQASVGDRGGRVWVDLHRTAATKCLYANPPDWPQMLVWRRKLEKGDLFLDVGANIGAYSVLCGCLGAEVIAFEPAPDTARLLRENVALNGLEVEVWEAAAGREEGTTRFTAGLDCVNRVDPDGETTVRVLRLDSVVGDRLVGGVKVDVEGLELEVLVGLTTALKEHRVGLLQLEWNRAADRAPVADLLACHGYGLWQATADGLLVEAESMEAGEDLFAMPTAREEGRPASRLSR